MAVASPAARHGLRPIVWVVVAFFALGSIYSLATPIFEAPDEWLHYPLVQYLADGNDLPVQDPNVQTLWEQEGSQPPLYYWLMASATRWIDASDLPQRLYRNPHASIGDASLDANRNLFIHSPEESFPWRGAALAVHIVRFISVGMGALTVVLGYGLVRRVFPERRSIALGTAMLIAFNPMFAFLSATVNNDNLIILLSTLAMALLIMCLTESRAGVDRRGWLVRAALGVVAGLAALTKVSGLTLLPVIALGLSVRHLRHWDWRGWLASGLLVALPVVAIAGWWYWRNHALYGEWFGIETMVAVVNRPRVLPATFAEAIGEFNGFRFSYWAVFGIFNILTLPFAYAVLDAFTLVGLIGWTVYLLVAWRRGERMRAGILLVLMAFALTVLVSVFNWTMMTAASQGRLIFPAIAVIALMLWLGWDTVWSLLNSRVRIAWLRAGRWSMPVFLFGLSAIVPFRDIAPVYAGPSFLTRDQLPADVNVVDVDFGRAFRLIGYRREARSGEADLVQFTLYWQCLQRPPADYSVYVVVYGRGFEEVGKRDAYPNRGLFATRECQPGAMFADPYHTPVKPDARRPTVLRAQIGLRDWAGGAELLASVGTLIVDVGEIGPAEGDADPQYLHDWRFSDMIALIGHSVKGEARAGEPLILTLYWRALSAPPESYTVFVHLLDAQSALVSQADGLPLAGDYPTDRWVTGDLVIDDRVLQVPLDASEGRYHLDVGLYRLSDGSRLPAVDAEGNRQPDDRVSLTPDIRIFK